MVAAATAMPASGTDPSPGGARPPPSPLGEGYRVQGRRAPSPPGKKADKKACWQAGWSMERQPDLTNRRPKRRLSQFNSIILSELKYLERIMKHPSGTLKSFLIIGIHTWMLWI